MTRRLSQGSPEPLGAMPDARGVNVAVFSRHASAIEVCLFDAAGERETERIRLPERTGDIFHGHLAGVHAGARYGLRAYGPFDPANGHRFNPSKLLVDPHALILDRPFCLHPSMFGYRAGDPAADLSFDDTDSAAVVPKAVIASASPVNGPAPAPIQWAQTVLYELHVRGFTKRHDGVPEALRGTFAGLGQPAALAHLAGLGVTSIEVMPAAAWIDERHLPPLRLGNYWGYNPAALMAPDLRLAPGGWEEIRAAVGALHDAGLEVILDVVLNHTGESDELGPTVSMRGLDNASYYRLVPGDPRHYVNDTGCGNCVALNDPPVLRLAMDTLRTWATRAGIDGFRFDLGTALGRRGTGFDPAAPLIAAIRQDPALRTLKLIAEPWDVGADGYQIGAFPPVWGEWNDRYRDGVRRFWRGDAGVAGEFATRFAGSQDLFHAKAGPSRGVNFVVAHDGFTLSDLVSYAAKHNEANGENNRDGRDVNFSWNHGVEGPSAGPEVGQARARDQRNLLATVILSRGTPMLAMGSEFGHSQHGNNNAYAQDNESAWLDWAAADTTLSAFTQALVALRRTHPVLRQDRFLRGAPLAAGSPPDVAWLRPDGEPLTTQDWQQPALRTLVAALCAPADAAGGLDRIAVIFHRGDEPARIVLPGPRAGHHWTVVADTAGEVPSAGPTRPVGDEVLGIAARSVVVLAETANAPGRRPSGDPAMLDLLATAAGIAPDWWDVGGTRHIVPNDTKRALLAGMGFAAETSVQARESLSRLSESTERQLLPHAVVRREGQSIEIRLVDGEADGRPAALRLEREDGTAEVFRLDNRNSRAVTFSSFDGRACKAWVATLPPQAIGQHRLFRDDRPDHVCHLTIAPAGCYLPPSLAGAKRFGLAAHLYTLRRTGDQGIGDFTTLAELAERAAAHGASIVGLNPLHALFPGDRERASPYHPSDRRFLDPIYLDLAALDGLPAPRLLGFATAEIDGLAAKSFVDYRGVWALKSAILEQSFAAFEAADQQGRGTVLQREFAAFVEQGGATLQRFACFEALSEAHQGQSRFTWRAALQDPSSREVEAFAAAHAGRLRYHMFLQWLCERQFAAAARRASAGGLSGGFCRDLAVGAAPDGAEIWAESAHFARGAVIGSPPDPFSAEGQVWHLPPLNPLLLPASNYQPFTDAIAANMRHAGALRIDHAMGLARLFFIPTGAKAAEGAYVAYPFEDLAGQLALASVRHKCLIVGEDLGTVPEGFRERMTAANVLSYRVLWFERQGTRFKEPAAYPARSVACVSTHDLPTLAGWWAGDDIAERLRLGLISASEAHRARLERADEKTALIECLEQEKLVAIPVDTSASLRPEVAAGVHAYLARTRSALVLAQADDLTGEVSAVNLPGTDRERPNWRRKLSEPVDALFADETAQAMLRALNRGRSAWGGGSTGS